MGDVQKIEEFLKKYYYDVNEPSSFQSANVLYRRMKENFPYIKLSDVNQWLLDLEVFGMYKPIKIKYKRNQIVSKTIDHIWQADLAEIHLKGNDKFKYLLFVIDNLSKFGWIRKLKRKTHQNIIDSFENIIQTSKRKPEILCTDSGKEFKNKYFKEYLKSKNIKHYIAYQYDKATIAERWIQTIKSRIFKYLYHNKTNRFIDIIDKIVHSYNSSVHSRTKFRPIDVTKENEKQVFRNLYKNRTQLKNPLLDVGDRVRVPLVKLKFGDVKEDYSKNIYVIDKILHTSPYPKYIVKDIDGDLLKGSFYEEELIKIPK